MKFLNNVDVLAQLKENGVDVSLAGHIHTAGDISSGEEPADYVLSSDGNGGSVWSAIQGGASVTVSSTEPSNPSEGDLWFDDVNGSLFLYYTDETSSQWIEVSSTGFIGVAQDVIDHLADTNNPHQVTAAQVGAYTTSQTDTAIANAIAAIIDTSPEALDTLNELAAAINDDPLFFQTIQSAIDGKADLNHTHTAADIDSETTVQGYVLVADGLGGAVWQEDAASTKDDLQNLYIYGKASAAITKGQAIQFAGAQGDHILIKPAVQSEINANPDYMIGIAETDAALNDFTYVLINGRVILDTSTYTAGTILWYDSAGSTPGALTITEPTGGTAIIQMAAVSISGVGNGEFVVRANLISREIHEIIGLQAALDSKVNKAGDTMTGNLVLNNAVQYKSKLASGTERVLLGVNADDTVTIGDGSAGYTALRFFPGGSEAMRIQTNGNVGIGTTSPAEKLQVEGNAVINGDLTLNGDFNITGTYTQIDTNVNTTEQWLVTNDGTGPAAIINQIGAQPIIDIQDDGVSAFYIADGGAIGIGTTSPTSRLNIDTGADQGIAIFRNTTNANFSAIEFRKSNNIDLNAKIGFNNEELRLDAKSDTRFTINDVDAMFINSSRNVGIGTTSPGEKLDIVGTIKATTNANNASGIVLEDDTTGAFALLIPKLGAGGFNSLATAGDVGLIFSTDGNANADDNNGLLIAPHNDVNSSAGLKIMENGNVGVGKASPTYKLDINNASNYTHLRLGGAGAPLIKFAQDSYNSGNGAELWQQDGKFYLNIRSDLNALVADTSGNIGINTSSPSQKLQVNGIIASYETGQTALKTYSSFAGTQIVSYQSTTGVPYTKTTDIVANGDGTVPSQMRLFTKTNGLTSPTERMRITDVGNVGIFNNLGIGTTSPSQKLHIVDYNPVLLIDSQEFQGGSFGVLLQGLNLNFESKNGGVFLNPGSTGAHHLEFNLNADTKMLIRSDGNVGIGTTNPTYKLDVAGPSRIDQALIINRSETSYGPSLAFSEGENINWEIKQDFDAGNADRLQIATASTPIVTFEQDGKVGIGVTRPKSFLHVSGAGNSPGGNIIMGNTTNNTAKWAYLTGTHYSSDTESEGVAIIGSLSDGVDNKVIIGGNIYEANPSTRIEFWTHTSNTHNTGGSQRMIINNVGNVGIGTATPSTRLSLNQAGTDVSNGLWVYEGDNPSTGGVAIFKSANLTGTVQSLGGNSSLTFITNASGTNFERMRITSTGNVGIGTTNPSYKLQVQGKVLLDDIVEIDQTAFNPSIWLYAITQIGNIRAGAGGAANQINHRTTTGTLILNADTGGNVGVGTTSPAQKLDVAGNIKGQQIVLSDTSNVEKARIVYDETSQSIKFIYS